METKIMWLPTGVWWRRYWMWPVIAILVIAIICLSIFLPRQRVEVEVPVEVVKQVPVEVVKEVPVEVIKQVPVEVVKEVESASLLAEVARLRKELEAVSKAVISIPAVPGQSELIFWTDTEAKSLMRALYPGTDRYRDPAFDSTMVYPLSWYQSILPVLPENDWPAGLIAWFSVRYPGMATGYAWVDKGEWSLVQIVPAHVNGTIDFYYLVDKTWVRASGNQDITPFVKAVNLLN